MNIHHLASWSPSWVRLVVALLLGLALWNPAWYASVDKMNAIIVWDESHSMGTEPRALAWSKVAGTLSELPPGSRYSLIRFGDEAVMETENRPTAELKAQSSRPRHRVLNPTGTNIEKALRMASRQLAGETKALLVLVTDGGETSGDATALLRRYRDRGFPVPYLLYKGPDAVGPDAGIDTFFAPSHVPFGTAMTLQLNVSSNRDGVAQVQVRQDTGLAFNGSLDLVKDQVSSVQIPVSFNSAGPQLLDVTISMPGDTNPANDQRRTIVNVAGPANIVYITAHNSAAFAMSLLKGGWNLNIVKPGHFPQVLARLDSPATIILDDVAISDMPEQVWMALTESVRAGGTGLIVLGGGRSFGAGGYLDSTLEKALPVTAQAGVPVSRAAVMFVIDKSGSMGRQNHDVTAFDIAKTAVLSAIRFLGENDFSGLIAFDIDPKLWLPLANHHRPVASMQDAWREAPSGGTRIAPALLAAAEQLRLAKVEQRLLILVTDGFTIEDNYAEVLSKIDAYGIDLIAMAIGDAPALDVLEELTSSNDGLLLRIPDVTLLTRRMDETVGARRLTFESSGTRPQQERPLPFLAYNDEPWPMLHGYMVTRPRANAVVYLKSGRGDPLLAVHDFGLGRVAALPGGLGRYAPTWPDWPAWAPFVGGLVEWTSQGFGGKRAYVDMRGVVGRQELQIDALSSAGDWETNTAASVRLSDPFGRITILGAEPDAPGRYRIELPLRHTGHHRTSVHVGDVSLAHDFFYESPAEINAAALARRTISDWLQRGLVRPWPAADAAFSPGTVTNQPTRSLFIALAALFYCGILLARVRWIFEGRSRDVPI